MALPMGRDQQTPFPGGTANWLAPKWPRAYRRNAKWQRNQTCAPAWQSATRRDTHRWNLWPRKELRHCHQLIASFAVAEKNAMARKSKRFGNVLVPISCIHSGSPVQNFHILTTVWTWPV